MGEMIKIISGGQTGADQGGLYGARDAGFPTGGFAPSGFLTEDGPKPDLLKRFGLVDSGLNYTGRTELNVRESDVTLWFGNTGTPGHKATAKYAMKHKKRLVYVISYNLYNRDDQRRDFVIDVISECSVVNVAGNRESHNRGLCSLTRDWMCKILVDLP